MSSLSWEAMNKIDEMVERVARKAGFTGRGNMTYQELLQKKFQQQYGNLRRIKDFTEEIRTYLQDGVLDLVEEGCSEEEALRITLDKFDEAELKDTFAEFAKSFEGFGLELEDRRQEERNEEVIGLFYGFFVMLGLGAGTLVGYMTGHSWLSTLTGLLVGVFLGVSAGLLNHAIFVMRQNKGK